MCREKKKKFRGKMRLSGRISIVKNTNGAVIGFDGAVFGPIGADGGFTPRMADIPQPKAINNNDNNYDLWNIDYTKSTDPSCPSATSPWQSPCQRLG